MKMKCEEVKKQLQAMIVVSGEKPGSDLMQHIKNCASCAGYFARINALNVAHESLKADVRLPADFEARVMKKLGGFKAGALDRVIEYIAGLKWGLATAAALAAVVFMLNIKPAAQLQQAAVKPVYIQAAAALQTEPVKNEITKNIPVAAHEQAGIKSPVQPGVTNMAAAEKQVPADKKEAPVDYTGRSAVAAQIAAAPSGGQAAPGVPFVKAAVIAAGSQGEVKKTIKDNIEIKSNVINPLQGGKMVIKYRVATDYLVKIIAYSKGGRPVRYIVNSTMAPGIYTAEWDGRDSAGSACGADTYIIYIDTGLVREKIQAVVVK